MSGLTKTSSPDNLAEGDRYDGEKPEAIATPDVKRVAAKLLDDETYQKNLLKRLQGGTAGAMEIWLWRWRYGDPKRATEAGSDADEKKHAEIRAALHVLITKRPEEARELEDLVLGDPIPTKARVVPTNGDRDPLLELVEKEG